MALILHCVFEWRWPPWWRVLFPHVRAFGKENSEEYSSNISRSHVKSPMTSGKSALDLTLQI